MSSENRDAEDRRAWDRYAAAALARSQDPLRSVVLAAEAATAMLEQRRRRFRPPPAHRPEPDVPVLLLPRGTSEEARRRAAEEIAETSLPEGTRVEVRGSAPSSVRGAA